MTIRFAQPRSSGSGRQAVPSGLAGLVAWRTRPMGMMKGEKPKIL